MQHWRLCLDAEAFHFLSVLNDMPAIPATHFTLPWPHVTVGAVRTIPADNFILVLRILR